jgi:hypothetical protein
MSGSILNKSEEICVVEFWNEGLDADAILKEFPELGVKKQVYRILTKYGIVNSDRFGKVRNHNYFDDIDTKGKAYFLGLLIAEVVSLEVIIEFQFLCWMKTDMFWRSLERKLVLPMKWLQRIRVRTLKRGLGFLPNQ